MKVKNSNMQTANPVLRYLCDSWIQTCGNGWTLSQIFIGYLFSVLLALGVLLASFIAEFGWSWIQIAAAALLAWDLFGGVIGYNHQAMKLRRSKERSNVPVWHHNLQQFYDSDNKKIQKGFQLYFQLILGYRFEFFKKRMFIEPAYAIKYWHVNTNFPKSFADIERGAPNYKFEPSLNFGFRF